MKKLFILSFVIIVAFSVRSEIKLPAIFSDGMLLQQQSHINIRGKADANKAVTIKVSWSPEKLKTLSDNNGNWQIGIVTPQADGKHHTMTISDGKILKLSNILLGDLWLCSGQSNMEMPMKGFKNQPVENSNMDILFSKNENIRLFTVKRNASLTPQTDVSGSWNEASPESVREFSATAYYFGRLLNKSLNIPVGLVLSAWGGSSAEAWMSDEMLKAFPDVRIPRSEEGIKDKNRTPTMLYNGMIEPLLGTTFKGIIWYQGETNYDRASVYPEILSTLVAGWRKNLGMKDTIPFYYCQIAPYDYSLVTEKGHEVINSAFLREAQLKALSMIPKSGMAVLLDAGLKNGIHPPEKQIPGERLALLALTKTYGIRAVASESPVYKSIEIHNDTIQISFDKAPMWITAKESGLKLFTVAGEDKVFHPAKAWIVHSKVYVSSDAVVKPVAVRYAFENYVDGDLFGTEGLPVSSFRSDNW